MKKIIKKTKQTIGKRLERYFKGASNHRRLDILLTVEKNKGITLDQISQILEADIKTISGHTGRLVRAGLLSKQYVGQSVAHSLSPYGKKFVKFIKTF